MKYFVMVSLCLLAGCKQPAVLGDGNDGGGGSGPQAGGNGGGGAAPIGGGNDGGGAAVDPMTLGASICESRAECETVEASCAHDTGCIFVIFREELYPPLTTCLANCGSFETCWQAAVAGSTPPDEFAQYAAQCNQKVNDCDGSSDGPSDDWCQYDFFSAADYVGMDDCWDVTCNDVNDCMRAVVFASEPSCLDF